MCYPCDLRRYNDYVSVKFQTRRVRFLLKMYRIPFLRKILTDSNEKRNPGMFGYFLSRFNFYDAVIKNCIQNNEISTIVNLGAGMDSKAYCILGFEKIQYFEVDHPTVIKRKKEKVKKIFGQLPNHVTYVEVDFSKQNTELELRKAGYAFTSQTLFILESVSTYLTQDENDAIFRLVSKAPPKSKIVFSYVSRDVISGHNLKHKSLLKMHKLFVKKHKILIHGFEPHLIEDYLATYGLETIKHIGAIELKARNKNLEKMGLDIAEVERFILAEVG